jgi:glycerol-3-phosphate dehydrogenase
LWAPTGGIVCPFTLTIGAMENAVANGVTLYLNSRVTAIAREDGIWEIHAGDNRIRARWLINAAGVFADVLGQTPDLKVKYTGLLLEMGLAPLSRPEDLGIDEWLQLFKRS